MKIIEKDILTVESGIICQQVNCQGKMNSGLAKSIREKWPVVYNEYNKYISKIEENEGRENASIRLLGDILPVRLGKSLVICNIFGQLNYGYDGQRYTDYGALKLAFETILKFEYAWTPERQNIYFPYNFGCDRGGADWNIVSKMIEYYFPNAIICKLPDKSKC
jgi:hypothetical protein